MILVLLGPPGVGKGTQGARISTHYGLPTLSTGAMFRDAIAHGTELGKIIQSYRIDQGEYVPDDIVIAVVKARMSQEDCSDGFLLDGFPRTVPQAEALDAMLAERHCHMNGVLDFEAPISVIVQRFSGRRVCPEDGSTYHIVTQPPRREGLCDLCGTPLVMRADDAPEIIEHRLEVYREKTAPLLEYYRQRGMLYAIDASADPETIFRQVVDVVDRLK